MCFSLLALGCARAGSGLLPGNVTYLDQRWSEEDRRFFYHASQGTRLVPFDWFMAVEMPDSTLPFAASDYVARYGFIPDPDPRNDEHRLPVGFALDLDRATGRTYLGITCSGCHTSDLTYKGATLRIDGSAALIDVVGFTDAVRGALAATLTTPDKFERFARAVLRERDGEGAREVLRAQMIAVIPDRHALAGGPHAADVVAGFGRLDALGRAGNLLFAPLDPANLRATNAPVSYPYLWGATRYDWAQWNGSIQQPMARNIAEALGVGAPVAIVCAPRPAVQTSIRVDNLHTIEGQLERLGAPRWPEQILGAIDREKAARGQRIYAARCAGCHEPALSPPNEFGMRFLMGKMVPLDEIGSDPTDAINFARRTADTGALGRGTLSAPQAFEMLTSAISRTKYDEYGLSSAERIAWDGYRANKWRAPLAYRARSLEGIWATAPYLHNGSVPNLYELLLPADQRSRRFFVGNTEIDPVFVGLRTEPGAAAFELVTDVAGNANTGHELRDGPPGKGVIGPALGDQDRWDLLEYLKTL